MANEITVRVRAEDQATATFQKVGKEAQGLGKVFSDVGKIAGGFLAANVVAGAAQKITGFIGTSIQEGMKLGESLNAVNKIFGESSKTVLDWGKQNATSFGLSQQAFNQLATPLGAILKNAGFSMDETADKTINLTKRAADMASVFNTDVDTALEAIMSGLKGEADPLEAFGVGLSAAKVEAQALSDTGKTLASDLTDLEKQTARYNLIMKETASVEGDFVSTSGEAANAARIQQARMEELQATIGTKLLPVQLAITEAKMAMVAAIADHVIPAIDNFIKYIKFVVEEGDTMNDFLANLPEPIQGVAKAFGETALFIKEHWDTIMAVFDFAVDYVRTRIDGYILVVKSIYEIVQSTVALVSAIFHGDWTRAWNEMKDIAAATIDLFIGYVKATFGNLPETMYNAGRDAGNALVRGLKDSAGSLAEGVLNVGTFGGYGAAKDLLGFNANGTGYWRGGRTVVGERGPEIVDLPTGSRIHSNEESRQMGGVNVYIDKVYARDEAEAGRAGRDMGFALSLRGATL